MESLQKHWSSVVTLGCIVIAALIEAWQQGTANVSASAHLPRLRDAWNYIPLILLIVAGVVWLIGRKTEANPIQLQTSQPPTGIVPGIPTLSALLGQNPNVEFDAKQFFARAYYSPLTAEMEKNIKVVAQQNSPSDKESFYAKFIGIGAVAYQHDVTWFTIYGSQLAALAELSSRGLIPVADLKKHYEKAVIDYQQTYVNYSLEQWMNYMKSRLLVAVYPSGMVELSFGGQDFLKYLAHIGFDTHSKPN